MQFRPSKVAPVEVRKGSTPRESWGRERSPGDLEQPGSPEEQRSSSQTRTWRRPLSLYMPGTPRCESMSGDILESPLDEGHRPLLLNKPEWPEGHESLSEDKLGA